MGKRLLLFLLTNILVILTISAVTTILGLHTYLHTYGINYEQLAYFCLLWGMGGSLIALLLSKFIAKMAMGIVLINPSHATQDERALLDLIERLAKGAHLKKTPAVGIYRSREINAFATGPSKHLAMIAISSGLLSQMNQDEREAVLSHEISHIANGDMVTMALLQGVVNAFSLFLSRLTAYAISYTLSRDQEKPIAVSGMTYYLLTLLFDIVFTLLGSLLVTAFSRWREYQADQGGANLVGRHKMIAALQRLQRSAEMIDEHSPAMAALMIASRPSWSEFFSTHPSLSKRIKRLQST